MWRCLVVAFVAACSFKAAGAPDGAFGAEPAPGHDSATVLPHDAMLDAFASHPDAPGTCEATECGLYNGVCVGGTCTITVSTSNTGLVACPAGEPCNIVCTVDGACNQGIDCSSSTGCTITCAAAADHCAEGNVQCSPGACQINCDGDHSCANQNVACAGACTAECHGSHSCSAEHLACVPGGLCTQECCGGASACSAITCAGNFGLCLYSPICF